MAPMEPISPVSRKRNTPSDSDGSSIDERSSKRVRIEPTLPRTPPPDEGSVVKPEKITMFNDHPDILLARSVALALEHVGFTGASKEALEAMCAEVDTYATHFLATLTSYMNHGRREFPTPLDYSYTLDHFNIPIASLEPHLRNPISAEKLMVALEELPDEPLPVAPGNILLGLELSGESDKKACAYIPSNFPPFPSKHTYKWTEKESARETDPRKIREEAAKTARQGEEALRRLTRVAKAGKEKDVRNAASRDPKKYARHQLWEQTMDDLISTRGPAGAKGSTQEDDRGLVVNAERIFYRKGPPPKRRPPVESHRASSIA